MSNFTFQSNATDYNPLNAYWSGRAASLAYHDAADVEAEIKKWGFDSSKFVFYDKRETQAFLVANSDMILLAFRGTEADKVKDWMTDADIDLVDGPGGKVHEGFKRGLSFVIKDIEKDINALQDSGQKLWITGHSLGAALAGLAAATLKEKGKTADGIYTFGQPRAGDDDFKKNYNKDFESRTFRFVNNNDVVTRVPPRLLRYKHVGTFRYFDEEGDYHASIGWWDQFKDRIHGGIDDLFDPGMDCLKDHSMSQYLKCLEKIVPA